MSITILLVEDDFDTLHPLAELLRLKGYGVITASEAEKALNIARESRPDLIITDIVLPGKSGLHFILGVRTDPVIYSTPIMVISGCGPMILVEAESAGANYCLEKPINIESFWSALGQVLAIPRTDERDKPVEIKEDSGRAIAGEIDRLVEELRQCSSRGERENVLRRLKEHIHALQARNQSCAGQG